MNQRTGLYLHVTENQPVKTNENNWLFNDLHWTALQFPQQHYPTHSNFCANTNYMKQKALIP